MLCIDGGLRFARVSAPQRELRDAGNDHRHTHLVTPCKATSQQDFTGLMRALRQMRVELLKMSGCRD